MERIPVKSSNIKSIGYEPESQKLHIEFLGSGTVYEYSGVSAQKHANLMTAASVGSHFAKHIRNAHDGKKVG